MNFHLFIMCYRLIKNRESAQQSRKRKKDKVGDLEGQVSQLEAVNEERKAKLEEIQAENVILKAEVSQLVNVIKDSPALSSLLMNVTSWVWDLSFTFLAYIFFSLIIYYATLHFVSRMLTVNIDGYVHAEGGCQDTEYPTSPHPAHHSTKNATIPHLACHLLGPTSLIHPPFGSACGLVVGHPAIHRSRR